MAGIHSQVGGHEPDPVGQRFGIEREVAGHHDREIRRVDPREVGERPVHRFAAVAGDDPHRDPAVAQEGYQLPRSFVCPAPPGRLHLGGAKDPLLAASLRRVWDLSQVLE